MSTSQKSRYLSLSIAVILAAIAALIVAATAAPKARSQTSGLSQSVTAHVDGVTVDGESADICIDGNGDGDTADGNECTTQVINGSGGLDVKLTYVLASASKLPNVVADAGKPDLCTTAAGVERLGIVISATDALFKGASSGSLVVNGNSVPMPPPGDGTPVNSQLVKVCLPIPAIG